MDLTKIISDIQEDSCRKCKYGQALIALQHLRDESEGQAAEKASKKPTVVKPMEASGKAEKVCNKCGQVKPLDEFPKAVNCIGGRAGICSRCKYLQTVERKKKLKKASAPTSAPPEEENQKIECKLCHAPCSSLAKLASHMRLVHGSREA